MKYVFLLFTLLTGTCAQAQNLLNFNKRFVESENKWVALKSKNDSTYLLGFIYMDVSSGLSVRQDGSFKIQKDGSYVPTKPPATNIMISRLPDNLVKVAWVPASKFKELDIVDPPLWLKAYLVDTTSAPYLFKWGFTYNGGGEIAKALYYFERVKKLDPNYPGLDLEFIYAYNTLKQYDKAATMIEAALVKQPNNGNLYKELLYAQVNSNQTAKAEETYKNSLSHCDMDTRIEMAFNLIYTYYRLKNKPKFDYWTNDVKQWVPATNPRIKGIDELKKTFGK